MVCMNNDQNRPDVRVWDLFNGSDATTKEVYKYRLEICNGCEFLRKATTQCKKCGCFMKLKATIEKAKCPIDKW